jgi:photosystem II stability/assembly factor-like uncharacterized protein
MRMLVGSDDGLCLIRWLEGERSGTVLSRGFEGAAVSSFVRSGDMVLAAVPERGVFRSADGGTTWEPLPARFDGAKITALVAAPSGSLLAGSEPAALHISRDGGATWTELESFGALAPTEKWSEYGGRAAHVEAIAFDRHDASRVYVGVEIGGAYRSDDAGATWIGINEGLFDDIHDVAVDPRDGSRVLAATGGGLYVSQDRGADWRPAAGAIGGRYCLRFLSVASTPAAHPTESLFLLGTADGPPATWGRRAAKAGARLWRSLDSGRTWEAPEEHGTRDASPVTALAANPRDASAVIAGTAQGHLLHGHLVDDRWRQIMYGLGAVRTLLVV